MKPDYEKKYKDALKLSRSYYSEDTNTFLDTLFPELRESEDERIRKGIIEIIKAVSGPDCDVYLDEKKQEKYIAWLEKQKEQEHICDSAQYEEGFKTGLEIGLRRQKEQKPAEWNANDKAFIKDCANILVANDYAASAERLLSMFPVKPAEWSEEDEEMLEEIINHIDTTSVQRIPARPGSAIGKSWIKFLKSLRPSWKPSEEQMKALQCAIVFMEIRKASDYDISPLKSLYEQLQKLIGQ